jgi:hypothetical protein
MFNDDVVEQLRCAARLRDADAWAISGADPRASWLLGLSPTGGKHAPSRQQGAGAILGFAKVVLLAQTRARFTIFRMGN